MTETKALVHVMTENGTVINTTENHPFYVEGKGWVAAAELEAGDVFHTKYGQEETVVDVTIEKQEEPVKVYNLTIEDYHTYYVSEDSVLVHNDGCGSLTEDEIKEAMKDADLKTRQKKVSIPKIERLLQRILNGETDNIPPIKVNGKLIIDGNHRYIASVLAGIDIEIRQWAGEGDVVEWADVIFDIVDWED